MHSKYAYLDGVAVHYWHSGRSTLPGTVPDLSRGRLLLFVHGAGSNGHTWHRQLAHFGAAHSALALDYPGHGRSGSTEGLKSIDAYAQFTKVCADLLRLRSLVFVGRGMGGAIGITFARAHPQRLRALVLVGTPATFTIPPDTLVAWHDVMRGRLPQPFSPDIFSPKTDPAIMREVLMEQVQTDPRVRYFDLKACDGFDAAGRAAAIKTPTLVVTGRDDRFATPDQAAALQRSIPGAELAVIDDAGHAVTAEQAAKFNAVLEAFLERI
jgi:3-oxoadipate enol-lactonase